MHIWIVTGRHLQLLDLIFLDFSSRAGILTCSTNRKRRIVNTISNSPNCIPDQILGWVRCISIEWVLRRSELVPQPKNTDPPERRRIRRWLHDFDVNLNYLMVYRVGKNDRRGLYTGNRVTCDAFSLTLDAICGLGSSTRQATNLPTFLFTHPPFPFLSLLITLCPSTRVLRLMQCILLLANQIR
jgi:hypothetical protein